jgi:hypothetical protein
MAQIILDSNSNLIQGDFDAATVNNRTKLQTSTTNATTGVYVVPNGSATSASVQIANAADPTNASKLVVATNGATDTQIVSGANGSGSYLPLSFYTNNDIRFQMGTAGQLNVRTAPGTVSSGTSGQFLTSGGPGAGVSWTTAAGGQLQTQLFTAPGTWTNPGTVTKVRVYVAGGGGGADGQAGNFRGGLGGFAFAECPVSSPVSITVGAGGAGTTYPSGGSTAGGTSSFGALVSATGGGAGTVSNTPGTPGTGTVSTGTPYGFAITAAILVGGGKGGTRGGSAPLVPATPYTGAGDYRAGAQGSNGTPNTSTPGGGGVGGAVVVEYVG